MPVSLLWHWQLALTLTFALALDRGLSWEAGPKGRERDGWTAEWGVVRRGSGWVVCWCGLIDGGGWWG